MHLENLKIFCDLVQSKSFSKAAKLNGITQSAVSQQLRAMEKHFNTLIIDRTQKQFKLTHEGDSLHVGFRDILQVYDRLKSELLEMKKVLSGNIHISTIYSIGLHQLPDYLKNFMKEFPSVNVRVEYRRANLIYEDVLQGAVDMGLVAFPEKTKGIEVIPFAEERLVLAISPEHPLAKHTSIDVSQLKGYRVIGFDQDIPTRRSVDEMLESADVELRTVMEFDNIETIKRAVEINLGVALLPEKTIQRDVLQGLLKKISIKDKELMRPLAIIRKKGRVSPPALKQFMRLLSEKSLDSVMDEGIEKSSD